MPAKEEICMIEKMLENITSRFYPYDINVIVDDAHSFDIESFRRRNIAIVQNKRKGKGAAIKTAIESAKADILVFIDADGSHNVDDIPKLLQPIFDNEADLVIASRIKGGSEEFYGTIQNFMHYLGNIVSSFIVNLFWRNGQEKITDCQNGFRAIRTYIARHLDLEEDGFAIEEEITIKCLKARYRIKEVPSYEFKRQQGRSHIDPLKMLPGYTLRFIKELMR